MHSRFPALLAQLLTVALLALSGPVLAAGMELRNEVFQDLPVKGKDGKPQTRRQPVSKAAPGSEIIYVITYRNTAARAADKVVITNPVPPELAYVPGSAEGEGTRIEASVDGGKSFGAPESLRVKDAKGQPRPARGEDVTHLRWTLLAPVPAGKEGRVSFRALVK